LSPTLLRELESRFACVEGVLPELSQTLLRLQKGDLGIRTKRNDVDLVTIADTTSEEILKKAIWDKFPGDGILAEESGQSDKSGEFLWVIDPVDGTINYSHGLPLFSVAIGIMHQGVSVAGIVELPAIGKRYRAIKGQGAFCDGSPIRVSGTSDFSKALVVTGFPYDRLERIESLVADVKAMLLNARGIRRTGSAAMDLCWIANGFFDAFFEIELSPWDTCAASVIAREAGARLTDYAGNEHNPSMKPIAASNGLIHEKLLSLLAEHPH